MGDWVSINIQLNPNPGVRLERFRYWMPTALIFRMGNSPQIAAGRISTTLQLQNDGIVEVTAAWVGDTDYAAAAATLILW